MNTNTKRRAWRIATILFFMTLLLSITLILSASAETYSGTCGADGDNLTWQLTDDGILAISGEGKMDNYTLLSTVPKPAPWNAYCDSIKTVTVADGVTSIGIFAFENCTALVDVVLPEGVTSIGNGAFKDCESLTRIKLPNSIESIGNFTFSNCKSLADINFPEGLKIIGSSAFEWCTALTEITLPESLMILDSSVFQYCTGIESVTFLSKTTEIFGFGDTIPSDTIIYGYTGSAVEA